MRDGRWQRRAPPAIFDAACDLASTAPRKQPMTERRLNDSPARSATASAVLYGAAFVSGAIVMSFEMLGSRYLNPYFGSGIYTWAALTSTVLAAPTEGYV